MGLFYKMKIDNIALFVGGCSSLIASALHIGCVFGGPDWYRFFGAGEQMAQMAARGEIKPAIITFFIASILAIWGAYGFAGSGIIKHLPFMRFCLVGISMVYLIRGFMPFLIMPMFPHLSNTFLWVSSTICAIIGLCYAIGTWQVWKEI